MAKHFSSEAVRIPAHVLDGIKFTCQRMLVFGNDIPSVDSVAFGSIMLGINETLGVTQWLTEHPGAYEQGMEHGFIPWNVN